MSLNHWIVIVIATIGLLVWSPVSVAEEEATENSTSTTIVEATPVESTPAQAESSTVVAQATSEPTQRRIDPLLRPTERGEKSNNRVAAFWFITTR